MSRGADDCGWRLYPPRHFQVFAVACVDPEYYAEADTAETLLNAEQDKINWDMQELVRRSQWW